MKFTEGNMDSTPITNYYGRTGAGKSKKVKDNVVSVRGRHLYIVPLKKSVYEVEQDFKRLRVEHDRADFSIHVFESDQTRKGGGVVKRILDRAEDYTNSEAHCVFVTTQSAFLRLPLDTFAGLHLVLDELLVNGVMSGTLHAPVSWPTLDAIFTLMAITDEEGKVLETISRIIRRDEIEPRLVTSDPRIIDADKDLFVRADKTATPVLIEATSIGDIAERRCNWFSAWTLAETAQFASVKIAACDFEESMMFLLSGPLDYTSVLCRSPPSQAQIDIRFFDDGPHTCSAQFWTTPQGKRNLIACARYLAKAGVDFWTCNDTAIDLLKPLMPKTSPRRAPDELNDIDGTFIPQRQEGTNHYRACTSCAMFLSSKAQEHEEVFERHFPGLTRAVISKSREGSLLWQFSGRGAPRCIEFAGRYAIYVYDRQQAEALAAKYRANGYPIVSTQHIALPGFTARIHERSGPKPSPMTIEERREHERVLASARAKAWRQRKKAKRVAEMDNQS